MNESAVSVERGSDLTEHGLSLNRRTAFRRLFRPGLIAVVLVALTLGTLFAVEARRRHGLYWYDVGASYHYNFDRANVRRMSVHVSKEGFILPELGSEWRTAFLRLSVDSRPSAWWFEPTVEVRREDGVGCRQAFERRVRGDRYLNLCLDPSSVRPGDFVHLDGQHLIWPDQEAEILLFDAPDPDDARILVLAPHADDAEIAAFGLYAGRQSWVVTVTTGSYGGEAYRRLVPDEEGRESLQAALRVWDSLVVPRWGGVPPDRVLNLGYFTLALELMNREPRASVRNPFDGTEDIARWRSWNTSSLLDRRSAVSSWENLVGDLAHLLEQIQPQIVVSPHPVLDGNKDHVFTTVALLEAMNQVENEALYLFLYTNHHPLSEYLPAGEAGLAVTLPPSFDLSIPFNSIYSHPVDERQQTAKLFALEAMHDLRAAPEPVVGGPLSRVGHRLASAILAVVRDPAREHSYFRRAVRSNELFFVYRAFDRESLHQLVN